MTVRPAASRCAGIDRIVVINDLSRPMGGASALAVASAKALRARGHAVTVLSGDAVDEAAWAGTGIDCLGLGEGRLLARGRASALRDGLWNRAALALVRDWIADNDTPGTVYHLHGWSQILSPAIFAALRPVRDRLVISAHDFFLACPNGAFADLRSGTPCPHRPLGPACLVAPCDRNGSAHKAWRIVRAAIQRAVYRPGASPPVLAIHAGMRPLLRRAGIPDAAIHALPNPVVPFSATRIAAETNREVLFVGRLEATRGLTSRSKRPPAPVCPSASSAMARWRPRCANAIRRHALPDACRQSASPRSPRTRASW